MTKGIVYCLSNPAYKGTYKVGLTTKSIPRRMKELYKTGVLFPFQCEFAKQVDDVFHVERNIHKQLQNIRVRNDREFFQADLSVIRCVFESIHGNWISHDKTKTQSRLSKAATTTTTTKPKNPISHSLERRRLRRRVHQTNPYYHK